ncbi:MAG: DUF5677 domain-containing protein [Bacteroidia bacterium]
MEKEKYKINTDLLPLFVKMKEYFDEYSKHTLPEKGGLDLVFELISKATIIKSYQFSLSAISLKGPNIFFMMPTLRGICEEYIVEKFIFEKFTDAEERGFTIQIWQQHEVLKSSIAQWKYFQANKPDQRLYYQDTFPNGLKEMEKGMKSYFKKKLPNANIKSSPFPSVYYMAKETELLDLYNYLYHATSTFVHFHPQNLFRMGWGNFPDGDFSTTHFEHYNNYFVVFYSVLLFCELSEWQTKNGYLSGFDMTIIKEIRGILNNIDRWPEIVTFEEMNIGAFSRNFHFKSPDMVTNK